MWCSSFDLCCVCLHLHFHFHRLSSLVPRRVLCVSVWVRFCYNVPAPTFHSVPFGPRHISLPTRFHSYGGTTYKPEQEKTCEERRGSTNIAENEKDE